MWTQVSRWCRELRYDSTNQVYTEQVTIRSTDCRPCLHKFPLNEVSKLRLTTFFFLKYFKPVNVKQVQKKTKKSHCFNIEIISISSFNIFI